MAKINTYGLTEKELTQAHAYMVEQGYIDATEDIISYARSMVLYHPFLWKAKIRQWSNLYEQSKTA